MNFRREAERGMQGDNQGSDKGQGRKKAREQVWRCWINSLEFEIPVETMKWKYLILATVKVRIILAALINKLQRIPWWCNG